MSSNNHRTIENLPRISVGGRETDEHTLQIVMSQITDPKFVLFFRQPLVIELREDLNFNLRSDPLMSSCECTS